ncbi:hypothetical protein FGO68_gene5409 [Halteria grandinella]|uniref:Uncharacterized protein n=1 Tax=Halteria grandinella TaxID=5974 RepID=A0A8J8NJN9_HALGN|nr:hypothetical protein FGO68_gene5409 [Halteria grandinella]
MNTASVPGDAPPKIIFRIVMIGFHGVGKTSFMIRYFDHEYLDQRPVTIGIDFKIEIKERDGRECKYQIWDTAGAERFAALPRAYYKNSHGMLIFVDLSQPSIEAQLTKWMTEIEKFASDNVCRLLVGTKSDLPQVISDEDFAEYAMKYNMPFIKTSSKGNINVAEAMSQIMDNVYQQSKDLNFMNMPIQFRGEPHRQNNCSC